MDIIYLIHLQLSHIEQLLKKDLNNKEFTEYYFVCEDDCVFLDESALLKYLTETKIENFKPLTSINKKCQNIRDLFVSKIAFFPKKTFKTPFIVLNKQDEVIEKTDLDFNAIYLTKKDFLVYNTEIEKKKFIKDFRYERYHLLEISKRCSLILNYITECHPQTKVSLNLKHEDEADNQFPLVSQKLEEVLIKQNTLIPSQKTLNKPYDFFVILTIEKSKNGEPFLTQQQLLLFLLKAFNQQKNLPKQKMNIGTREYRKIHYFFYEFMTQTIGEYENSKQLNEKYLKILTDNFIGFNYDSIILNFAKKPSNPIPTKK